MPLCRLFTGMLGWWNAGRGGTLGKGEGGKGVGWSEPSKEREDEEKVDLACLKSSPRHMPPRAPPFTPMREGGEEC